MTASLQWDALSLFAHPPGFAGSFYASHLQKPTNIQKREATPAASPPRTKRNRLVSQHLFCIVHLQNSNALVISAVFANLVRSLKCAAVAACAHCRCIELPNSRTSFVTSCLGDLILRYSHVLAPPSTFDSRRWFRSDCTRKYRTNPCSPPDKASLSAA